MCYNRRVSLKIQFINHACFHIIKEDYSILVDPWFYGKVFNDSWALIQETQIDNLDLSKLKYIFISHEHPDHLHWLTLRQIKEKCEQKIQVLMAKRKNDNVKDMLLKLGYCFTQFEPYRFFNEPSDNFSFSFFKKNHDAAIVFKIDGKIIFNKNDCKFSESELLGFKSMFGDNQIDFLFNQFSLAGFYANKQESHQLHEARNDHLADLVRSHNILKPKLTIPFASFITFCRPENIFLNNFVVSPLEVFDHTKELDFFVPFCMDIICSKGDKNLSESNANKWQNLFTQKKSFKQSVETISRKQLESSFYIMGEELRANNNHFIVSCPKEDFLLSVVDRGEYCKFNFFKNTIDFLPPEQANDPPIGVLPSYDLNAYFKFPWGADTLNITSCFEVFCKSMWKKMLIFKDSCYVR